MNATINAWHSPEPGAPNGGVCGGDVVYVADNISGKYYAFTRLWAAADKRSTGRWIKKPNPRN